MIILDENILDGQRLVLEGWKIAIRQVGLEVGRKGLTDEEIVILLRRLRQPTFLLATMDSTRPAFDMSITPSW